MIQSELVRKYDVPAPRYTSYPTVPYWSDNPTTEQWIECLKDGLKSENASWALYIHIPFCESLCTYCGCNTSITKNHQLESPYAKRLIHEWKTYLKLVPELGKRELKQLHLGGGTPTFLSAQNLKMFLSEILADVQVKDLEASIEVDPRRTTIEQLEVLYELGFRRISLGVQDFNPDVQRIVNRFQPYEITEKLTTESRRIGYNSVNFDLIYGLPLQNPETIRDMAYKTIELRPDRIALYSFAMVPWIKPAQRLFKDEDVPKGEEKRALYEISKSILLENGYKEIGMDHFALETDQMWESYQNKKLHRNFMGYADRRTDVMLGLGVSSISEAPKCFHQNEKVLNVYEQKVDAGIIPTHRGHVLTDEDQFYREQILTLMTTWSVDLKDAAQEDDLKNYLKEMIQDQMIVIENKKLTVLPEGKPFLRNICMGFDQRMRLKTPGAKVFSQSI